MDPVSEQGLAAPSLYHGCSTDSNSDWNVVGKNNKPVKSTNDITTEETNVPREENSDKKNPKMMKGTGSPPYRDDENPFGQLHDDADEENPDEETEEKDMKVPPPRKKMKIENQEEDWNQVCNEFQNMAAPEYARSNQPTQVFQINTTKQDPTDDFIMTPAPLNPDQKLNYSEKGLEDFKAYEQMSFCFGETTELYYDDKGTPDIHINRHKIMAEFQKVEQDPLFQQYIHEARTLPKLYDMNYPAMKFQLFPNHFEYRTECQFGSEQVNDQDVWASHGQKKKNEQLREESTFLMYEIARLGMFTSYKAHYDHIEDHLNRWRVPHAKRHLFRRHELNYLSLMIHDTLPEYYMDYLLPKDEPPKGRLYNYFHKDNDSLTARYKWYAAIKNNYKKFYQTVLADIDDIDTIDDEDVVMMKDIIYIMIFINPTAMLMLIKDMKYRWKLNSIISAAYRKHYFVATRHEFFYEWLYFGWAILPDNFPLYKNKDNDNIDTTTMWVHKTLTHEEYINKDLITMYDDAGNMARITVQNYVQNGEKWRELAAVAVPDTREFNDTNYLNIGSENGAELARDHWIYERNYDPCFVYDYDDIKYGYSHNDHTMMTDDNDLSRQVHYEQMAKLISGIMGNYDIWYDNIHGYFKNEMLNDYDDAWSRLDTLYYDDYHDLDRYYVPVRRSLSIYWIKWRIAVKDNVQLPLADYILDVITKYTLYFPGLKNIQQNLVKSPMDCTWYDVEKYQMKKFPNKTISKRYLWARIQHLKKYFKNSVEPYDDLLLKYDALDQPVLHPLYTVSMAHDGTHEYLPDNPCTGEIPFPRPFHTMYLDYLRNPQKLITYLRSEDVDMLKCINNAPEESLPLEYRTVPTKLIVPTYLFGNKFEEKWIPFISEQLNQHVHDLLLHFDQRKAKGARVSLRKLPTTVLCENYSEEQNWKNKKITALSSNDPSINTVILPHHVSTIQTNDPEIANSSEKQISKETYILEGRGEDRIRVIIEGTRASNETRTKYSVSSLIPIPFLLTQYIGNILTRTPCTDTMLLLQKPTYQEFQVQPTREYALASTVLSLESEPINTTHTDHITDVPTHDELNLADATDDAKPTEISNFGESNVSPTRKKPDGGRPTDFNDEPNDGINTGEVRDPRITSNFGSDSKINQNFESTNLSSSSDPILISRINHFSNSDTLTTTAANQEIKTMIKNLDKELDVHANISISNDTISTNNNENDYDLHDNKNNNYKNKGKRYSFEAYDSLSEDEEWSDNNNINNNDDDSSSTSSSSSTTTSSSSINHKKIYLTKTSDKKNKKKGPSDDSLCKQSLSIIKLLGTMRTKKLDLKHEPKARRIVFLEWLANIEVAFTNCKYTRKILKDYNTQNKIRSVKSPSINRMVYAICYALMEKNARCSTMAYKDDGIGLLKALHIKCASVDSQTRLRAKTAFIECRISQEETAINFLTRLEQKANEARNYDIKISEKKFIYRLLNNMKHHKYYRSRIASFLTQFELNPNAFNQRWLENKFYALDEERILHSKLGIKQTAQCRFISSNNTSKNSKNTKTNQKRCKYCYRIGHTDYECRNKQQKRPPSMPEWVANATCNICKKKGHLAFNCPPKYNNQKRKDNPKRFNRYNKFKNKDKQPSSSSINENVSTSDSKGEYAAHVTHEKKVEFAGRAYCNDHNICQHGNCLLRDTPRRIRHRTNRQPRALFNNQRNNDHRINHLRENFNNDLNRTQLPWESQDTRSQTQNNISQNHAYNKYKKLYIKSRITNIKLNFEISRLKKIHRKSLLNRQKSLMGSKYSQILEKLAEIFNNKTTTDRRRDAYDKVNKVLNQYLKPDSISTFEDILKLQNHDLSILQTLINSPHFKDIRQAYKTKKRKRKRKRRYKKKKQHIKKCEWVLDPISYKFGEQHPHEISLFGRTLTNEERERYFGPPKQDKKQGRSTKMLRTADDINLQQEQDRDIALNTSDDMKYKKYISYEDLEHGWIIDSGASAHMTPYKSDCERTYPVLRQVFMADGSSIICKEAGDISIPLNQKTRNAFTLRLKDVLIIPELDRRLFSVNSFLNKGNNWVQFSSDFIELGIKSGPRVRIPITSLQSSAMIVTKSENKENINPNFKNNSKLDKKRKISLDMIHDRFLRSHGTFATIMQEDLWQDVTITPGIDKFCTSSKIMTIPTAARGKTRSSDCKKFLEEIQVDTVPNPEPFGLSAETRFKYFLIFCDRYSRIFRTFGMQDKSSKECARAIEGILAKIPDSTYTPKDITYIRSDAGTEFRSAEFNDWCLENSIVFSSAAPKHQHQNGLVERHWKIVYDMANSLILNARLSPKFFAYALKYAEKMHDVIPVRDLTDDAGRPTIPYIKAFGKKPYVQHFKTFGCPAVFKRFEISKDGKRIINKYNQQGMRGIFVGIPDDSAGWLFYVPDAKRTYISMDASFDERFTSPMALPELPFKGAIRLRESRARKPLYEAEIEMTGTSVDEEERFPHAEALRKPTYSEIAQDITELSDTKRGPRTRGYYLSREDLKREESDEKIKAYFVAMVNNPEITDYEYLRFVHETKTENLRLTQHQDNEISLSDFLPEPRSLSQVIKQSESIRNKWGEAIQKELRGLFKSDTFITDQNPLPSDEVVPVKLTLKTKLNSEGGLDKLKARICLRGDMQERGDINTWSPTSSGRLLKRFIADAIHNGAIIYQLDFIQAFIQSETTRRIFVPLDKEYKMFCPELSNHLGRPLRLRKCLYGADFSGKTWYETLDEYLTKDMDFTRSMVEGCLYTYVKDQHYIKLINYVDDALYYCSDDNIRKNFEETLSSRFDLTLMGKAKWYLGMQITQHVTYITLDQSQYARTVASRLEKAFKNVIKERDSPLPLNFIPTNKDCPQDTTQAAEVKKRFKNLHFRSAIGSLLYMSCCTRPDICYAVNKLAKYSSNPGIKHYRGLLHLIGYIKAHPAKGIQFFRYIEDSPVYKMLKENNIHISENSVVIFTDSSWNDCVDTGRSTGGYNIMVKGGPVDYGSHLPIPVAMSSGEAEYIAAAVACMKGSHLRMLGYDFEHMGTENYDPMNMKYEASFVIIDNEAAKAMSECNKDTAGNRHIARRYHYVRQGTVMNEHKFHWISTKFQLADPMTKGGGPTKFESLEDKYMIDLDKF